MNEEFNKWVISLSKKYKQSQIKAVTRVNSELILFYFALGKEIYESSFKKEYGNKFFATLSNSLKRMIPNATGFSIENLRYIEKFYILYKKISQQVAGIFEPDVFDSSKNGVLARLSFVPWGHHMVLIDKCNGDIEKTWFYVNKIIENNWSRSVLEYFISTDLYMREGKAITNFAQVMPKEDGDLANQLLKSPYIFGFIDSKAIASEKELKDSLVSNVKKFLLELGTGFSFVGQEYRITIDNQDFYIDLLFYNILLHSYVVVEVKVTKFKPEYIGQLNFYVTAINHELKGDIDSDTIGLLICSEKNNFIAKYSLENMTSPLGISSYEIDKPLPEKYRKTLPAIEEIEQKLSKK